MDAHVPQKAGSSENATNGPLLVIAKYKFEGRNNDELSFAKNDVITVTQQLEGGWWEGTLDGRVGWFPADFVGIVKITADGGRKAVESPGRGATRNGPGTAMDVTKLEANRVAMRAQLVQDFLAKDKEHLEAIGRALDALIGLAKASTEFLQNKNFGTATAKLADFVNFKRILLRNFEEQAKKPLEEQHLGKLFLETAPEMRIKLRDYCQEHCDLVELLNSEKAQIERLLAKNPAKTDLKAVVLGLSLVFRHIQKYAGLLQEIERNTPETHPDRGNLQRAVQVCLDFHEECETIRRQREAQLDFLQSGIIQEHFGKDFEHKLGKLLYTGKVGVSEGAAAASQLSASEEAEDEDSQVLELDRCIAIFSSAVLLLEMSPTGQYSLKNRFGTVDLVVRQIEAKNIVELKKGKDSLAVRSVGKKDFGLLLDALQANVGQILAATEKSNGSGAVLRKKQQQVEMTDSNSNASPSSKLALANNFAIPSSIGNLRFDHQLGMVLPDGLLPSSHADASNVEQFPSGMILSGSSTAAGLPESITYSGWALRPLAPRRAEWLPGTAKSAGQQQIKLRKGLSPEEQEDASLLRIVEGYCFSAGSCPSSSNLQFQCCAHRQRQRNSADSCHHSPCGGGPVRRAASFPEHQQDMTTLGRPQLIVAEDEKIFVEEMEGDQVVVKERSLVDTVYALKDQLFALTKEVGTIAKTLEHEQRARRRMEEYIRQSSAADVQSDTTKMPSSTAFKPSNESA